MGYEQQPGTTSDQAEGGEYDSGSQSSASYPISSSLNGYNITPGVTGNISSGGQYDDLDSVDSISYSNLAAEYAGQAAQSANAAANSATEASASAISADISADIASDAAGDVNAGVIAAAASATSASNSATTATTQAGIATTQATNASASATSASTSASTANTAATTATTQAGIATTQATAAATSATNAATTATLSETSATNAATSASSANTSASTATTAATTATTQAGIATTQAGIATTQATNSANSATTATTQAGIATTQAGIATTQAGIATTQAGIATTQATNAASSATAAEAARDQALAAFDNFDDMYLGDKSSDPTVDNDGNPLQTGALYFNTVDNVMKVYTGTAWVAAYVSGAGVLLVANNLSDVQSAATSRTNLGLGTAATTDSTAYATAAQGALADSALQPASIGTTVQGYNANTVVDASYVHTDNNYTTTEKSKLAGIAAGAEVNVNADWNASSGDAQILNKPTLGTAAATDSTAYATAAQGIKADTALQTVASADGSIIVTTTGTAVDLAVSQTSPASVVVEQVRNTTGATLTKGTAVYISGATGQLPTVSKALATGDSTSAQTLGLITNDISNNSNGYVTIIGLITNINTSAYTDGDQLYLSPTTAGTLTATKPYAPNHMVYVAVVAHAHPSQGKLLVKVQNGYEMDELHDVSAQSPTTGQTLVYNSTTSLWEKSNAPVISSTTINSTSIGATTPSTGAFTTLSASGNAVISVTDNTNAALRITQLGTGNALLVEDETNPDSTPFVVTADGRVILGTTEAAATYGATTPFMQVRGTDGSTSAASIESNSTTATRGGTLFLTRSRGTTVGSTAIVADDDRLASIIGSGADGSTFVQAARIDVEVDGTPGTNDMPGRLVFSTTADGASTPTERMRIDSAGRTVIGASQAYAADGDTQQLQVHGLTQAASSALLANWSATATSEPNLVLAHSRSGVVGTQTASVLNDNLGNITFCGSDGSVFNAGVGILAEADGTWSGSSTPAKVTFFTVPSGATTGEEALSLTSGQGVQIARTAVTSPVANDGNVFSGTYTPTQVSTNTNVSSVTYSACQYMRVGNTVTVSGQIAIDPTLGVTNTVVLMSLPIASSFSASRQLGGTGSSITAVNYAAQGLAFMANSTDDCVEIRLNPVSASTVSYIFSFTYQVL